jgi:predicted Zn-dependent protease
MPLNDAQRTPSKPAMNTRPSLDPHRGCALCALRSRRLFTGLFTGLVAGSALGWSPAWAQQDSGLRGDVGRESRFTKLVSAEQVEGAATQQYAQMLGQYNQKGAVLPASHPQVVRLRAIAQRIIPFTNAWNGRAAQWRWEVNLLNDAQVNAFCMPGGKIAFYAGILVKLQLSDDEVATIMGHEMAHALREHARERMGKTLATRAGASLLSSVLGLGGAGDAALNIGGQLLTLRFSREDETEADLVGMDLAARAGHDPAAGVTLWQKMMAASQGAPPQFLSTHPAGETRIRDIQSKLPKVQPLFAAAEKPTRRFGPPPARAG